MPPGKLPAGPRSDSNAYQSIPLVSIARVVRMVSRLVGAGGRSAGSEQAGGGAEGGVGGRGLGRVIGRRVAAHHGRGGVAEEVLHVQLPGLVLDRPGGEGVAEAVGVGVHAGALAQPREEGTQQVFVHRSARLLGPLDREEQRPLARSPEPIDVRPQRGLRPLAEGHHPLLAPLAVADVDAAVFPGHVGQGDLVQLRVAQAGVQEEQDDRPVAAAVLLGRVAHSEERLDLLLGQGLDHLLLHAHVGDACEGVPRAGAHPQAPGEEGAGLAEAAVPGAERNAAVGDHFEEGIHVGRAEGRHIVGQPLRDADGLEAAQRLRVGVDRARALALHLAGREIGGNGLSQAHAVVRMAHHFGTHDRPRSARPWTLGWGTKSSASGSRTGAVRSSRPGFGPDFERCY